MYEAETVDVPKDKVRVCSKKGGLGIYSECGMDGASEMYMLAKKPWFKKTEMHRVLPSGTVVSASERRGGAR